MKERHWSGYRAGDHPDFETAAREYVERDMVPRPDSGHPDPDHPLWNGLPSHDERQNADQYRECPTIEARRLRAEYQRMKDEHGLTLDVWAAKCSSHGKSGDTASAWLKSPSTMERDEVLKTCALFNCSLEYLQGLELSVDELGQLYQQLSTQDRVKLCARLWELIEWADDRKALQEIRKARARL